MMTHRTPTTTFFNAAAAILVCLFAAPPAIAADPIFDRETFVSGVARACLRSDAIMFATPGAKTAALCECVANSLFESRTFTTRQRDLLFLSFTQDPGVASFKKEHNVWLPENSATVVLKTYNAC